MKFLKLSPTLFYQFQVLAEEAHPLENLDRGAAQEALNKAQSELNSAGNDKVQIYYKLNDRMHCYIDNHLIVLK